MYPDLASAFLRWTCIRAALAENAGEVVVGLALAAVARAASGTAALTGSAILLATAGAIVAAAREMPRLPPAARELASLSDEAPPHGRQSTGP